MEIKFEVVQEMYVLLGRIEERINTLRVVMDVGEEGKEVGDGLLSSADWDEILDSLYPDTTKLKRFDYANVDDIFNIGEYAERILSYVRASDDRDMMLECCKVDRDVLHGLMVFVKDDRVIASLLKCVECLFKIHNIALEKIWGINAEDIENCKYCIDIYGECYLMNADEKAICLIQRPDAIQQSNNKSLDLPIELCTDVARVILKKAIDGGLMDSAYKWGKSKSLLAYFADKTSEYLGLCKGEYDGKPKVSWKPFEALFGIRGLSGAKRDYQKTGTLPGGYEDVDKLFK